MDFRIGKPTLDDTAATDTTSAWTLNSLLRRLSNQFGGSGSVRITDGVDELAIDSNGAIAVTGAGGGTQYTEDVAAAADPVGTALNLIRADTPAAVTTTDGDNVAARGTNKGELYVKQSDAIVLGAGTAEIGKLAAGTANIGDVDVLTVPAPLSTTGTGTEATALRVTVATDSTGVLSVDDNGASLTVDGTVTANLAAGTNNIGDVDVLSVPAPLNVVGGGAEATALRVTLANDSTGLVTVTGLVSIDTGTVTANLADGDNNIGNVDIVTVPAPLSVVGTGTEAAAMRVTIATDSTGVLSVDDNGASLTVDVGTALPAGTNAIGKLAANSGVDIGDVDVLSIAAGENHLGEVHGNITYVTSTPTLTTGGVYASGDYMGPDTTPTSFASAIRVSGGKAKIKSILISNQITTAMPALELWLFSATITVPADNAAWSITDADSLLCVGVIPINTPLWYASALNQIYCDDGLDLIVKSAAQTIFYALVARGTTPSLATNNLAITLGIEN